MTNDVREHERIAWYRLFDAWTRGDDTALLERLAMAASDMRRAVEQRECDNAA